MSEPTRRKQLKTFPDLRAADFQHPLDVRATEALRRVPGLDLAVSKVLEHGFERLFYVENVADNVRVTARMFPRLHRYLGWGCRILGIEEPELYVTLDPNPNAFTFGHKRPFVVLTSGLVDTLGDEELFFCIGHELGHIKAEHVLYTLLARNIAAIVSAVGNATFGIGSLLGQGLVVALYDWFRKAELTADRAGLLCVQDTSPCISTLMKLAGGANRLHGEMDQQEFLRQVRSFEEVDGSLRDRAYKFLLTAWRPHPFPILRAKELDAWSQEGYRELLGPRGLLD
jgi:Zn-dependent protease with chaperone function